MLEARYSLRSCKKDINQFETYDVAMEEYIEMYDIDYPDGGQVLSNKAVSVTNRLDDRPDQEYMLPCGSQEMPTTSEYEQPKPLIQKQYERGVYKSAGSHAQEKVLSDCNALKSELKSVKRCLCALSLFVAILSLISLAAFSLAVLGFLNPRVNATCQESDCLIPTSLQNQLDVISAAVSSLQKFNDIKSQPSK